ncbi:MAG TPA: HEAT repeat domain-containing protein, partial [Planctomycetota bacterium]|nr:HEAT repeat domain-containing protein [Planctomycetota bacterium]
PSDPRAAARARQVGIYALGQIRRPGALKALIPALDDKDDAIAAEAARAIGEILKGRLATEKERTAALEKLERVFEGTRAPVKDAALDAVRDVLKAGDAPDLQLFTDAAGRLMQAKDYDRAVRLLKDLPERLPADAAPAQRDQLMTLRDWLANAYESKQPPDPNEALRIWSSLAKDNPEKYSERYADELAAIPSEKADEVYSDLVKRRPTEALRFYQARIALVRKLLTPAASASPEAAAQDRRKAVEICERLRVDDATTPIPPGPRQDFLDILRQLKLPDAPVVPPGGEGKAGGPVPTGMPKPPPKKAGAP